jgi:chromosome segregation ATPase
MPPKKKDPKGGGDDDKPPPPPELPELTPHQLEMNERALVAEKLTHSLAAFRTRTASLERTNAALRTALGDTTRDANEVETYLTLELAARQEIVDELRTRVDAKTAEVDGETKGLDARVQSARAAAEAETATLTERVTTLRDTEADITRRRDDKTRILDGLAEVSETVAKELHEMKANLHELESSLFRDRERLRRESAMRVKATRLSLMRLTDDQLETTTKRVIAQNERASSELADISKDANDLIGKTDQLSAEHSTFGRELTLQRLLVRNTEVREGDLRRCVDALAREVSRSDIAKASANEGVNSAQSAEDANRGFDFDDAVSTTAGLERETEALRSGLVRHTAAMEGLARRARAFGAG